MLTIQPKMSVLSGRRNLNPFEYNELLGEDDIFLNDEGGTEEVAVEQGLR